MKASAYGIKNLKRIMPNLVDWTKEPNESYANAKMMYGEVVNQFGRYLGHVSKNIGGITTTYRNVEEPGSVLEFVPEATQKEAMKFLQTQLFTTPVWLLDKKLFALTGVGDMNSIAALQSSVLNHMLNGATIEKLVQFEAHDPSKFNTTEEVDRVMAILKSVLLPKAMMAH